MSDERKLQFNPKAALEKTQQNLQIHELNERIKELEDLLERSQIKNVLTEVMIDIAEDQFKIDIRKKHGPKQ